MTQDVLPLVVDSIPTLSAVNTYEMTIKAIPTTLARIPQPPSYPGIGNVLDIDPDDPIASIVGLHDKYGPIIALKFPTITEILVGSQELVHELCDQERFKKDVGGALEEVRRVAGDGLFTAHGHEPNWAIAHRILIPSFGPLSIRSMFGDMFDVASQLVIKWHRFGDTRVDVCSDFTKATLDTIALCTFSYRFNSFYTNQNHPFVDAMAGSLRASSDRMRRLPGTGWMYVKANKKFKEDIKTLHDLCDELVKARKDSGERCDDLLDRMLYGRDPVTGQGLSSENIRFQLATFLIAGHETTSGLLSFLFHYLLATPRAYHAVREEVDRICGDKPIKFEQIQKLEYVDAALKEALRLKATAPGFSVTPKDKDEIIGGKYLIRKGQFVMVILDALHTDPKVWGNDAQEFRPERMMDGGFKNLPPDSWKPFGNGVRGCIGRPFAWQESLMIVAMIFQNFDIRPHNPEYKLKIKQTLTVKPDNFYMHVAPRKGRDIKSTLGARGKKGTSMELGGMSKDLDGGTGGKVDLSIYYGSNSGTCKALARKLAATAGQRGLGTEIKELNAVASGDLPTDRPIAIVTTSYEGQPTDDANFFFEWLKNTPPHSLTGVTYGVFGCGHPDWVSTYHFIPTTIDKLIHTAGGTRLVERGIGNSAEAELFDEFDAWETKFLNSISQTRIDTQPAISITVDTTHREKVLELDPMYTATVVSNDIISKGTEYNAKRHIEIKLSEGMTYKTGDYLNILPTNPDQTVQRVLRRFNLHADDVLTIQGIGRNLPVNTPISAMDLLSGFVELGQPATRKQVEGLLANLGDGGQRNKLQRLTADQVHEEEVVARRVSLLDLLEAYPEIKMDIRDYLLCLPPLRIRQYSISSSPMQDPTQCSITISIIAQPHLSGQGEFFGTTTSYLAHLTSGSKLRASIKDTNAFRPPLDPSVPILMAAAGSGIAPFRAFIQERAIQKASGRDVGQAILYYGCHSKESDALYDSELSKWEKAGVVSVRHAFSRSPSESRDCKYVQDRIYLDREDLIPIFKAGGKVYICGSPALAEGVKKAMIRVWCERKGKDEVAGREWLDSLGKERLATDVFI